MAGAAAPWQLQPASSTCERRERLFVELPPYLSEKVVRAAPRRPRPAPTFHIPYRGVSVTVTILGCVLAVGQRARGIIQGATPRAWRQRRRPRQPTSPYRKGLSSCLTCQTTCQSWTRTTRIRPRNAAFLASVASGQQGAGESILALGALSRDPRTDAPRAVLARLRNVLARGHPVPSVLARGGPSSRPQGGSLRRWATIANDSSSAWSTGITVDSRRPSAASS